MFISLFIYSKQYLLNASWVPATMLGKWIQAVQEHISCVHISEEWNDEGKTFEFHMAKAGVRRDLLNTIPTLNLGGWVGEFLGWPGLTINHLD